ncbi:hypothetical protein GCM10009619_42630 [Williamsia maris]|uniref:Uncharacterized protein n=1 Tax=Williamsia maris TaxID=72806 RepID=A0ABT1HJQ0_9NOCA|nr:hypothetical protein [Williamsia maris]
MQAAQHGGKWERNTPRTQLAREVFGTETGHWIGSGDKFETAIGGVGTIQHDIIGS